jgi:hypothetical protein
MPVVLDYMTSMSSSHSHRSNSNSHCCRSTTLWNTEVAEKMNAHFASVAENIASCAGPYFSERLSHQQEMLLLVRIFIKDIAR